MKENAPQPRSREVVPLKPTLIRILVEFDNGIVRYLEGADAREHDRVINSIIGEAQFVRGAKIPELDWKEVNVREAGSLFNK